MCSSYDEILVEVLMLLVDSFCNEICLDICYSGQLTYKNENNLSDYRFFEFRALGIADVALSMRRFKN